MANDDRRDEDKRSQLVLKVKRVRSRLTSNVKTGATGEGGCASRTDPTENGYGCPTVACGPASQKGFYSILAP